jgi:hypothetical protein
MTVHIPTHPNTARWRLVIGIVRREVVVRRVARICRVDIHVWRWCIYGDVVCTASAMRGHVYIVRVCVGIRVCVVFVDADVCRSARLTAGCAWRRWVTGPTTRNTYAIRIRASGSCRTMRRYTVWIRACVTRWTWWDTVWIRSCLTGWARRNTDRVRACRSGRT